MASPPVLTPSQLLPPSPPVLPPSQLVPPSLEDYNHVLDEDGHPVIPDPPSPLPLPDQSPGI